MRARPACEKPTSSGFASGRGAAASGAATAVARTKAAAAAMANVFIGHLPDAWTVPLMPARLNLTWRTGLRQVHWNDKTDTTCLHRDDVMDFAAAQRDGRATDRRQGELRS